jgi:hypothetical protein
MGDKHANRGPDTNTGHGHVWRRPDKFVASCGGVQDCAECKTLADTWKPQSGS